MRVRAGMDGLADALRSESSRVFSVVDDAVRDGGDGLKAELRSHTADALGGRVANSWRGKYFANQGDARGPAAFIWSKAPRIIDFFSADKVVTPIGQAFAVPTASVPKGPRGRRMTPIEVEARFNAELQPVRLKSGNIGLFIDVISARSGRRPGLRAATKGRRAQGRAARKVLMFVLIKQVRGRKLIDLSETAQRWGARVASDIDRSLGVSA